MSTPHTRDLRALAQELGMSPGELLRLAREAQHDQALVSVDLLTMAARRDLYRTLAILSNAALAQERCFA